MEKKEGVYCSSCRQFQESPQESLEMYRGRLICRICVQKEAEKPNKCPNCGAMGHQASQVGLVLVPPKHTQREKLDAATYYAVICPACKIVYFDEFMYNLLYSNLFGEGSGEDQDSGR